MSNDPVIVQLVANAITKAIDEVSEEHEVRVGEALTALVAVLVASALESNPDHTKLRREAAEAVNEMIELHAEHNGLRMQ